ncbi:hypothetical protein EVA_05245 [gut metagenome]|uniref:Uncharacterized protein n=1 Tax=gut metagenome TaxID=749906 RepID=J9GUY5_9ZZZZ
MDVSRARQISSNAAMPPNSRGAHRVRPLWRGGCGHR